MHTRLETQTMLETVLGTTNVYFQPDSKVRLQYPCAIYNVAKPNMKYADNGVHLKFSHYRVTIVSKDPDDPKAFALENLPHCAMANWYSADNLNHWVYDLYY